MAFELLKPQLTVSQLSLCCQEKVELLLILVDLWRAAAVA